ncbi:MAG: extracellular solute-binding protein [Limnochordales bacterium]|nr:extracellular solute-binding protein [Limnochordales bacterium]
MNPDVRFNIELQPSWNALIEKLLIATASGAPPTLTQFHTAFLSRLVSALEPIPESIWPRKSMQQLFWNVELGAEVDGSIRFTPGGLSTGLLWLNLDLLDAAGVRPTILTWDDLRAIARKLTRYTADGRLQVTGFFASEVIWDDLIYQQGQFMWDEKGKRLQFNSAAGRKALTLIYQLQVQDKSWHQVPMQSAFLQGQIGILYEWGWIRRRIGPEAKFRWATAPIPTWTGQPKPAIGRNSYEADFAVLAAAPDAEKAAAFRFLRWLYEESSFPIERNLLGGRIPAVKKSWSDPRFVQDPVFRTTLETIPYTIFPGERPDWINQILRQMYQQIREGAGIETALTTAQEKADQQLQREPVFWIVERRRPAQ